MNTAVRNIEDVERAFQELYIAGWTSYTPTWAGASSNPSLGNGTLLAAYQAVGGLCSVSIQITMGSTTTYGSSDWSFTLPIQAVGDSTLHPLIWGNGMSYDATAGTYYGLMTYVTPGQSTLYAFPYTATGAVQSTKPFAWAASDKLYLTNTYPVEARVS